MDDRTAFPIELGRVTRRWRARLDERLKHTGLTQARWLALVMISRAEKGITQRELAEMMGVEGPTLVRILDALEKKRLVERRASRGDRRVRQLYLTPAAEPILDQIMRISTAMREELLAEATDADIAAALRLLRTIGERLEGR